MKKTITMPKFRDEVEGGVLCAWMKEEGDTYKKGEVLYEVETDKVVQSVEAQEDGTLLKQLVEEGDVVQSQGPIAEVEVE